MPPQQKACAVTHLTRIGPWDVCFVGGGVANMVAAWQYAKRFPNASCLLLEQDGRLGGRIRTFPFAQQSVIAGAGIGRLEKDVRLMALLKALRVPYRTFPKSMIYADPIREHLRNVYQDAHTTKEVSVSTWIRRVWRTLLRAAIPLRRAHSVRRARETFRSFAIKTLGSATYKAWIQAIGYTDFERADVIDTLDHYGLDDTFDSHKHAQTLVSIDWDVFLDSLANKLYACKNLHVQLNTSVHRLYPHIPKASSSSLFQLETAVGIIHAHKVVLGVPLPALARLQIPSVYMDNDLQKTIISQPFSRVYAEFSKRTAHLLQQNNLLQAYTVLPNALNKVIPIRPDLPRPIYMIAYSDNANAVQVARMAKKKNSRSWFEEKIVQGLGLPMHHPNRENKIKIHRLGHFYWPVGTHAYAPLPVRYVSRKAFVRELRNPLPNVHVVGEMASYKHQGWIEGALETVDAFLRTQIQPNNNTHVHITKKHRVQIRHQKRSIR